MKRKGKERRTRRTNDGTSKKKVHILVSTEQVIYIPPCDVNFHAAMVRASFFRMLFARVRGATLVKGFQYWQREYTASTVSCCVVYRQAGMGRNGEAYGKAYGWAEG